MKKGMIAKCGGCMKRERDVFLEGWRFKREWRWHEMWCVQGGGFFILFILFILFYFILFILFIYLLLLLVFFFCSWCLGYEGVRSKTFG